MDIIEVSIEGISTEEGTIPKYMSSEPIIAFVLNVGILDINRHHRKNPNHDQGF